MHTLPFAQPAAQAVTVCSFWLQLCSFTATSFPPCRSLRVSQLTFRNVKLQTILSLPSAAHSSFYDPSSGDRTVDLHGAWLEEVVALEVLAWLNPAQQTPEGRMGLKVHRAIVRACRQLRKRPAALMPPAKGAPYRELGKFRRQIILAINSVSEGLPQLALNALERARSADVRYQVEGPFAEGQGLTTTTEFSFDDVVFGHPAMALEAMVALRGYAPRVQCDALNLLKAKSDVRLSMSSAFHTAVPKRVRDSWLRRSRNTLDASTSSTEAGVQGLVDAVWHGLQCASGTTPLAAAVPGDASDALLGDAAKGYQDLSWALRTDFVEVPQGSPSNRKRAETSWAAYRACGVACGVIAAWLMALSANPSTELCEFCYRHRETRRRCRVHTSPDSATREARLGKLLSDSFARRVMTLTGDPSVRKVFKASLVADALDLEPMLLVAEANGVGVHLQYSVAVLATQLRVLRPLLNDVQVVEASKLFNEILGAAAALRWADAPKNVIQENNLDERRSKLTHLVSLPGFLKLWWGSGASGELAVFQITGRGFDLGHPLVTTGAHDPSIAHALLRHRAWMEVSENFVKATSIDRDQALALRADGASHRQIGQELGCSHTKVRLLLLEATPQIARRRAVLKPYRLVIS